MFTGNPISHQPFRCTSAGTSMSSFFAFFSSTFWSSCVYHVHISSWPDWALRPVVRYPLIMSSALCCVSSWCCVSHSPKWWFDIDTPLGAISREIPHLPSDLKLSVATVTSMTRLQRSLLRTKLTRLRHSQLVRTSNDKVRWVGILLLHQSF